MSMFLTVRTESPVASGTEPIHASAIVSPDAQEIFGRTGAWIETDGTPVDVMLRWDQLDDLLSDIGAWDIEIPHFVGSEAFTFELDE